MHVNYRYQKPVKYCTLCTEHNARTCTLQISRSQWFSSVSAMCEALRPYKNDMCLLILIQVQRKPAKLINRFSEF